MDSYEDLVASCPCGTTLIAAKHDVDAHVDGMIDADGSLLIDADDKTKVIVVAGELVSGDEAGIGLSAAVVW